MVLFAIDYWFPLQIYHIFVISQIFFVILFFNKSQFIDYQYFIFMIMMDLQKNIELIRKNKGLKQSVVAQKLGISQSAYSNYITRNSDIKFSLLVKIAEALQVRVIDIITYPDKYVLETSAEPRCKRCEEKDTTIASLNKYIALLEGKVKIIYEQKR